MKIVQHRRGSTSAVAQILGFAGELFVDTSLVTVVVMDGVTTGGTTLARISDLNIRATSSSYGTVRADGTSILVTSGIISANTNFLTSISVNYGYLGTSVAQTLELAQFTENDNANTSTLRIYAVRQAAGFDWTTRSTRIQQRTDITNQEYIEFNPWTTSLGSTYSGGLAFGVAQYPQTIEAMRIWYTGAITAPYQPAFICQATNGTNTYAATTKILFNNTPLLNRGSYYSPANSRFTAPVAGLYMFRAQVFANNGAAATFRFAVNGTQTYGQYGSQGALAYAYFGFVMQENIYMNAGDYCEVFVNAGTGYTDSNYCTFSGYLIG